MNKTLTNALSPGVGRIDVADVLRGFAVMGIVVLHSIEHFNLYDYPQVTQPLLQFTDRVVWDSLFFAFGGKAYAIFALLFGFSFYVQDSSAARRGCDFRGRFAWRLVLLFIFGNINAAFFVGEVLVLYSLVGFLIIPVCRLSNKTVLWIAAILMLQPMEWGRLLYAVANPDYVAGPALDAKYWVITKAVQMGGSFFETIKCGLWEGQIASLAWAWENGRCFQTPALFMLGMVIGRTGLFTYSRHNIRIWFTVLIVALAAFFPLNGLWSVLPDFVQDPETIRPLRLIIKSLANVSFMSVLVSSIILLYYTTKCKDILKRLAPYGRMSLTNYITQSVVGAMLFYGWGFGLHKELCITYSALVGVGLFIIQYMFNIWWLRGHRQGPLEWLWKRATWIKFKQ